MLALSLHRSRAPSSLLCLLLLGIAIQVRDLCTWDHNPLGPHPVSMMQALSSHHRRAVGPRPPGIAVQVRDLCTWDHNPLGPHPVSMMPRHLLLVPRRTVLRLLPLLVG